MAQNHLSKRAGRKPGGKQPITQHPLFPVIVALWFGALSGLASIIVRPTLIERVVLTLGIDTIIPMAAPPLGTTFRILLAIGLAVAGGVIGFLLARRMGGPAAHVEPRKPRTAPAKSEAPASPVHSSPIGETVHAMFASRNRGQTEAEPAVAAAAIEPEPASTPAGNPQIVNVIEFELEGFEQSAPEAREAEEDAQIEADDPFETGNPFATSSVAEPVMQEGVAEEHIVDDGAADYQPLNNRLFETYSREMAVRSAPAADQPRFAPSPVHAHVPEPGFDLLPLAPSEPTEEPGFAVEPGFAEIDVAPATSENFDQAWVDQEAEPIEDTFTVGETTSETGLETEPAHTAAERIVSADLDALSPVELLERLGLALERKRAEAIARAETAQQASVVNPVGPVTNVYATPEFIVPEYTAPEYQPPAFSEPDASQEFGPAPGFTPQDSSSPDPNGSQQPDPDVSQNATGWDQPAFVESAPEDASPSPSTWDIPAALRPVSLDGPADESDVLPGYVPPRHIGLSAALPGESDEDEGSEEQSRVLEDGYSSLLGLSRSAAPRQTFIPEEPAQPFDGDDGSRPFAQPFDNGESSDQQPDAKPDPQDTERALRAALATLQRMSGAA